MSSSDEEDLDNVKIMNVKTIIESAFGNMEENRVNFKLIQTVLFLLARQLRILDRHVALDGPYVKMLEKLTTLEVTEVKVHAAREKPKKSKQKSGGTVKRVSSDKNAAEGDKTRWASSEKSRTNVPADKSPILKRGSSSSIGNGAGSGKDGDGTKVKPEDYQKALEAFIIKREKELRVIHQRADSIEEPDTSPKPMTSIAAIDAQYAKQLKERFEKNQEKQYEKLLVVERVSVSSSRESRTPSVLSVVTQEEFMKLVRVVRSLQAKFGPIGSAEFPKNAELMEGLRKTASLTDAMAALQLSARLEAAENILGRMIQILSMAISTSPGMQVDSETRAFLKDQTGIDVGDKKKATKEAEKQRKHDDAESGDDDFITHGRLKMAMKSLYDEVMKNVRTVTTRNTSSANQALKLASTLESKLADALNMKQKKAELEEAVCAYAEQICDIDTGLSSQMTNYQEQLTQMQHELEVGLDAMADALTNTGGDTVAVAELNTNFLGLQMDFDGLTFRQKVVSDELEALKGNIANLWKQVEMLRATKSDRDEVTDALRDKAGIRDLNGLVPMQQFNAVRGDFEKQIDAAYNKFNNQELIWQKAIDEIFRELNDKGDLHQLYTMEADIRKHLEAFRERMEFIYSIIGEPKTAIIMKRLFRDAACICCSTPATMDLRKQSTIPTLPKYPDRKRRDVNDECNKQISGDGDSRPCYFGLPVTHALDPRVRDCHRYCGGSHTLTTVGPPKVPSTLIVKPLRKDTTEIGTEDKQHQIDEKLRPCVPCNVPKTQDPPPPPTPSARDGMDVRDIQENLQEENSLLVLDSPQENQLLSCKDTLPTHPASEQCSKNQTP